MADTVYLVRHAAPPPDRRDRFWGRADPGVDPASLRGVAALADLLPVKPTRLFSSPLSRASLTAGQLAGALRLDVEYRDDLAEADFGVFDGLSFAEIQERYPEKAGEWGELLDGFAFPGGENIAGFLARAEREWRHCLDCPDAAVMAVAHGGVITAWTCLFLGLSLQTRFEYRPSYCALTAFTRKKNAEGWEMLFFDNLP